MKRDTQSRKWLVTINNFLEHGYTREILRERITALKSLVYFCASEEIGLESKTHHIHIFIAFSSGVRFSTMKNVFEFGGDIKPCRGSCAENRDYVGKTGKWENDEKADTKIDGTFEEYGEMPQESQGFYCVESNILERIKDGATNAEILQEFPYYMRGMRDVDYVRQTIRAEEYRDKWRDIETTYIWGSTGLGKTRSIMDGYGYSNVFRVHNYKHPFDGYMGEGVMLFDEFNSQIRIQDMNNLLDGYPLTLNARYNNKQACFEQVFIISNLDLREQYKKEQERHPEVWRAFIRRIDKVIHFMADGTKQEYDTCDYLAEAVKWENLTL